MHNIQIHLYNFNAYIITIIKLYAGIYLQILLEGVSNCDTWKVSLLAEVFVTVAMTIPE